MFRETKAFRGFSVDDIDKAKEFYGQKVGLEASETHGLLTLQIAGGARFKDPAGNILSVLEEK